MINEQGMHTLEQQSSGLGSRTCTRRASPTWPGAGLAGRRRALRNLHAPLRVTGAPRLRACPGGMRSRPSSSRSGFTASRRRTSSAWLRQQAPNLPCSESWQRRWCHALRAVVSGAAARCVQRAILDERGQQGQSAKRRDHYQLANGQCAEPLSVPGR